MQIGTTVPLAKIKAAPIVFVLGSQLFQFLLINRPGTNSVNDLIEGTPC